MAWSVSASSLSRSKCRRILFVVMALSLLAASCGGSNAQADSVELRSIGELVGGSGAEADNELGAVLAARAHMLIEEPPRDQLVIGRREAGANPDGLCRDAAFAAAVSTVIALVGEGAVEEPTVSTGRGCRTQANGLARYVDVRLEFLAEGGLDDVAEARAALGDDRSTLMGFEELDFRIDDRGISSSLFHPTVDRLEEHRWLDIDGQPVHLSVSVEPVARTDRSLVLPAVTGLGSQVTEMLAGAAPDVEAAETSKITNALFLVLDHVAAGVPLGEAATQAGADAIAFEYAFPENIAAIANYRDDAACGVTAAIDRFECRVGVPGSTYHFEFALVDGTLVLDGFEVLG